MVARLVVENVVDFEGQNVRKAVTEAMRDPVGKLGNPDIIAAEYRDSETSLLAQSAGGRVSSRWVLDRLGHFHSSRHTARNFCHLYISLNVSLPLNTKVLSVFRHAHTAP